MKQIGPHRVTCSDVQSPDVESILAGERVSVLYSDPPWGDGNLKYWATMNAKMTGRNFHALTYDVLLDRIFTIIDRYVTGHVFLVTGPRWEGMLLQRFREKLHNVKSFTLKYGADLDNMLIYGGTAPEFHMDFDPTPIKRDGVKIATACVKSLRLPPGAILLDPCCGLGNMAKAAINCGLAFRGNEFNEKRLQRTIDVLNAYGQKH